MKSAPDTPPHRLQHLIGQSVAAIDTPALVVDLDAMERNLQRMADYAKSHGVKLRPHAKMHKSAALGLRQMQAGAVGLCVQKTSEAEALAAASVNDLYISNEVIAHPKLQRVAALARSLQARGGRLAIAVDSLLGIAHLAQAMGSGENLIDVFVELDVGQKRCGVAEPADVLPLAQAIARHPALRLAGLQAYNGRAQHLRTVAERRAALDEVIARVQQARRIVEAAGLSLPLVTGAGSGTFGLEATSGVFGELQAGSYLFMDADYARNEVDTSQPQFEHALFVKTQVMSVSAGHVVVDAGHKSHAIESGLPRVHGEVLEATGCNDEHTTLRATSSAPLPALGETLWLIPGHCDPTVNLHDWLIGVRGGLQAGSVAELIRVDARGCLD
ncbi:DSD1 family PLP-dependent enzyme [Rhodoferax sp. BAB1]|uniref:DSD1 family PLP-dependent enzyme n=1 Tax=Rhodoferax sp. BAB1 TaxID=2741720 RepID=UPI001576805A|nr:DSD1 family PLP-dependent enzyme [Rhodoferax sp. BAB1]QKO20507.1 DSD1 family PLP-dependent enzyme [Rhodoferax sp. BAB1]